MQSYSHHRVVLEFPIPETPKQFRPCSCTSQSNLLLLQAPVVSNVAAMKSLLDGSLFFRGFWYGVALVLQAPVVSNVAAMKSLLDGSLFFRGFWYGVALVLQAPVVSNVAAMKSLLDGSLSILGLQSHM
jgi:hypothetical protein